MKGLIVKSPWIDKILSGEKDWEIRGRHTKVRGKIALIKSGTGTICGTVNLWGCSPFPTTIEELSYETKHHQIQDLSIVKYNTPYVWYLKCPQKIDNPIPYNHPQGAVIWVNLPDDILEQALNKT